MGIEQYNKAADRVEDNIAKLKRIFNKEDKYTYGDLLHVHKFIKWAYAMHTLGKDSEEFKREFRTSLHNDMERDYRKLKERHHKLVEALGHDKRSAELTLAHLQAVQKSDQKMVESQEVVAERIAREEDAMNTGAPKDKLARIKDLVGTRPVEFKDRTDAAPAVQKDSSAAVAAKEKEAELGTPPEDADAPPSYNDLTYKKCVLPYTMPLFVSNNKVTSDLMLIVKVSDAAVHHSTNTAGWVTRVVSQLFPVPDLAYPHMAVAGTLRSNFFDSEAGETRNEILVAVHQSNGDKQAGSYFANSDFDGTVVMNERSNPMPALDARIVADALALDSDIPDGIEEVGVSAVSSNFMKELWKEIIAVNRTFMDGNGLGPMMHPMWMWSAENGVHDIREMSFTFGWD